MWAFAGGSLRETNGSKHIDFEFFRTLIDYSPGDVVFGNTGNDGGRTAWDFDATGNILVPGTLIVSIDYEGGGTKPDVRIRVWMNQADLATFNSLANRPFNIDASSFEQGLSSGVYGYVRIEALNNAVPYIFGRVNKEAATLGPPWGTIEGSNAAFQDDYKAFQFVEIGINLTAFGLDRRGDSDPCSNILGSLLVKTRSSAGGNSDSFTSELKDFAGPCIFGNSTDPSVDLTGGGTITCTTPTVTLTANLTNPMTSPGSVTFTFYGPDNDNDPNNGYGPLLQGPSADNTIDINAANGAGTYTVVVDALAFPGCSKFDRIVVNAINCDPVDVSGPGNLVKSQCDYTNQAALDTAFAAWLAQFQVVNDGCEGTAQFSGDPRVAPSLCTGGTVNVTYSIADNCSQDSVSASFTLNGEADVDVSGPGNLVKSQCDYTNQAALDTAFAAWLAQFVTNNDGCAAVAQFSGDPRVAPSLCTGGTVNVTYSIADNCSQDSVSASFTLNGEADVDVSGSGNLVKSQCDYTNQAALDTAFAAWLAQFVTNNDGCAAVAQFSGDSRVAPSLCIGGTVNVTYSIADNCSQDSVSASFTLNGEADVDVSGPGNLVKSQCDYTTQAALDTAFAAWLAQFVTNNDGCAAVAQFSGDPRVAPSLCTGGTVNVTYSIADNCSQDSVSASFTLNGEADVDVSGPGNLVKSQCDYTNQADLDTAFAAWLAQFVTNNDGCAAVAQFSGDPRVAPSLCTGGTVNVTYSIADNCSQDSVSASFTLNG
ncbi:hypothetical protein NAT51_19475, partial [Flavobacterium amniphilum]|uniref:hypothetical protein n=1 Tax=Flavobacterium amniphilum TaxID=1834035 RepID=UPI00202A98A7